MRSEKDIKKNPMFLYLAVLTIGSTIGLQAWLTLFNNFAVEVAGLGGNHIAAVFLPAMGDFLWVIDYRIPFCGGAAMSVISMFAVQFIRFSARRR